MKELNRIEQIHFELQAIARIQDPEERVRILGEYRRELEAIGGVKSSIKGTFPGLLFEDWVKSTPYLNSSREDYGKVFNECRELLNKGQRDLRRLRTYRAGFDGAKAAFYDWFEAPSDRAVSEIFSQTYEIRRKDNRYTWKGSSRDAILFARTAGISTKYLNSIFVAQNGKKFQDSGLKPDRRKDTDKPKDLPNIVKVVTRFKPLDETLKLTLSNMYGYNVMLL